MQLPALQINQPDVGAVMERIGRQQTRQYRNRLLREDMDLSQQRFGLAKRKFGLAETKYADERTRENRLVETRRAAFSGDKSMKEELFALDPDSFKAIQDRIAQASEEEREVLAQENLESAQQAHWIKSAPNPMAMVMRWEKVRASDPEMAEIMPEVFDEDWLERASVKVMAAEELLKEPPAPPSGFERTDTGLRPITGGPGDPDYVRLKVEAGREPESPYERYRGTGGNLYDLDAPGGPQRLFEPAAPRDAGLISEKRRVELAREIAEQDPSSYQRDENGEVKINRWTGEPEIDMDAYNRNYRQALEGLGGKGVEPRKKQALGRAVKPDGSPWPEGTTKTINGKTYIVHGGQWFSE
ncbi:MAG: hypothetical protein IIA01_00225 [Proteobacteria bacterium]|nr:hypothetical protein [Pseudomonadota bacterium]